MKFTFRLPLPKYFLHLADTVTKKAKYAPKPSVMPKVKSKTSAPSPKSAGTKSNKKNKKPTMLHYHNNRMNIFNTYLTSSTNFSRLSVLVTLETV